MNTKLNELKNTRQELIHKIESCQNEITRMDNEGVRNVGQYNELKSNLSSHNNKLQMIDNDIASLENAAGNAQDELVSTFDNFEIGGIPFSLRGLIGNEENYQLISAFFMQYVGDQAEQHASIVHSYKSEIEKIMEELTELENVQYELDRMHAENIALSDRLADAESKRDAAAREIAQAKEEIARLKADNEQLRERIARPTQTNVHVDMAELARKIHEAKPAIYNKRWKDDLRRNRYLAELAATDETIEFSYLEVGNYRELEGEELSRFREEQEEKKLAELAQETLTHAAPSIEKPSLPLPNAEVPTDSTDGEMAPPAAEVTRAEFEELKNQVVQLQQVIHRVA